jgi:hypothetical protein
LDLVVAANGGDQQMYAVTGATARPTINFLESAGQMVEKCQVASPHMCFKGSVVFPFEFVDCFLPGKEEPRQELLGWDIAFPLALHNKVSWSWLSHE